MEEIYDLIILGGGPASMSAGVYARQMKLKTLLIEKSAFGGQVATTSSVSNYLGFEKISGEELSAKMHNHVTSTGIEIIEGEVIGTSLNKDIKEVQTFNNIFKSKTVIIGIGTAVRKLGVDNENKYIGKGLSYSSLRDRAKFENKVVAVVGGGNSAIEDAIYLAEKCSKVYLIHRRNEFRADRMLVEQLHEIVKTGKIELILEARPHELYGDNQIERFDVEIIPTQEIQALMVDGVFVAIGRGADTDIIDENILRNSNGYIVTDENMKTNIDGVYAIGDIRNTPLRQIVTAVADGAIASVSAFNYLKNKDN